MSEPRRRLFDPGDVAAAQAEVDQARGRLNATIEEIHLRISPRNLLDGAIAKVRERGTDLAQTAGGVVRERPGAVVAGAATIGLLLAARPLSHLVRRFRRRREETPAPKPRSLRTRKPPASKG